MWRFARTYYNNVEKGRAVRDKRVKLSAFSWEGWLFALLVRRSCEEGAMHIYGGEGYEPILVAELTYIAL